MRVEKTEVKVHGNVLCGNWLTLCTKTYVGPHFAHLQIQCFFCKFTERWAGHRRKVLRPGSVVHKQETTVFLEETSGRKKDRGKQWERRMRRNVTTKERNFTSDSRTDVKVSPLNAILLWIRTFETRDNYRSKKAS